MVTLCNILSIINWQLAQVAKVYIFNSGIYSIRKPVSTKIAELHTGEKPF